MKVGICSALILLGLAQINWVWLLFGNEKSREKSGDFGRCRRGDGRKLPGYRGEGGISPGLALPFLVFSAGRSEEHTSELQSHSDLVCRLLLEKKNLSTPNQLDLL